MLEKIITDLRKELEKELEESAWHQIKMKESELKILDLKETLAYLNNILKEKS